MSLSPKPKFFPTCRIVVCLALIFATGCDALRSANPGNANIGNAAAPFGAPAADEAVSALGQIARDIEEADIVKVVGDKVYALNRYKGLIIIDVANPDAPAVLGTLDLRGRGVEMYVIGQRIYAILSADFYYALRDGPGFGGPGNPMLVDAGAPSSPPLPEPDFDGSQLAIIDISNAASPTLLGKINLVGYANQSRRVGDIIYVVGSNLYTHGYAEDEAALIPEDGFVASVNVADPDNIVPVERKTFSANSLDIHVSATTIFAAGQEYDANSGGTITHIQAIDISDPAGVIAMRGTVDVPGRIRNRFYMDEFDDVLRVATESDGFGFRSAKLYTYDASNLDAITPLGQVEIIQGESLEAVRFDGPRGYAVTFLRVDPLFVIDLSDPANPSVTGSLTVPGFSTHLEPRGNRLIAVGIDDTDGRRPAIAYYNVEDPANPSELGRVILGPPGSYTESDATYDEKAFKIVDALGLIAIPFNHVEYPDIPGGPIPTPLNDTMTQSDAIVALPQCISGVQLVDFSDTALTQRGSFEQEGRVQRVGVIGPRVFALSQAQFQTINIADRDHPIVAGKADFFDADEMLIYGNDCGYYGGIPFPGPGPGFDFVTSLLNGLCGTMSLLPMMILPLTLCAAKRSRLIRAATVRERRGTRNL
jgi:hypothetical protein